MNFRLACIAMAIASTLPLACQEIDESAPSHPRTEPLLIPNAQAQENASKRAEEPPARVLPGAAGEIQRSAALPPSSSHNQTLALAQMEQTESSKPSAPEQSAKKKSYNPANYYPGPLPHIPANPGTTPMIGSTPVPNSPWTIDHSWGQGIQLTEPRHRDWEQTTAEYHVADVRHNPTYYFELAPILGIESNNSYLGDWSTNIVELPWFYFNTLALPLLMIVEPPLAEKSSPRLSHDPNYTGYLSEDGEVVPSPSPTSGIPNTGETQPATQPAK